MNASSSTSSDFTLKPSCGFHYILHAVDHFSKYHWAWALPDKRPATVSFHLATLLSSIGPVKHIQCDQGKEFVAEVLDVLKEFGCGPMLNSAAYHPQTNGLVERGNGMLKVALEHWFIQERTTDWYPALNRIRYQINCLKPRTTRFTPYELVCGMKPPSWEGLAQPQPPLRPDTMERALEQLSLEEPDDRPAAAGSAVPPIDAAATILTTMAAGKTSGSGLASPHQSHMRVQHSQMPAADLDVEEPDMYPEAVLD